MRIDRFIAKSRIIDLKSEDFEGVLGELLATCPFLKSEGIDKSKLITELIDREKMMTTNLGHGVALPHMRIAMTRPYVFAIGRCVNGLAHSSRPEDKDLRLIFLLLASEGEEAYLNVLAFLARILQDNTFIERLVHAPDLNTFRYRISVAFSGVAEKKGDRGNRFNRLMLREAEKIAHGSGCSSILIFGDTFAGGIDVHQTFSSLFGGFKLVFVTQNVVELGDQFKNLGSFIAVRSLSNNRLSQLRSAILVGLSRGLFKYNDRVCCVGGVLKSNQFDSLVVVDIEREYQSVFTRQAELLPPGVKPEILERVLEIAIELSVEGREGRHVGCLFVIGEPRMLHPYLKPLVLNPFFGYDEEDRNILNPFMDETVKEFSSIDGAFIISGEGVLESAGTLIHAPGMNFQLPGGLGSRHAAACAISLATDCISIVVSSSTGQVTLFRRGQLLPIMEKSLGNN